MKLTRRLILLSLIAVIQAASVNQYAKFKRVDCRTSGKTCKNPYCDLKLVSKTSTFMNYGCTLEKPFDNVHARLTGWMRSLSGGTWRQIISVQDLDVCGTISNIESSGMFRESVSWMMRTFPGMWQKRCPFKTMQVTNASFQPYRVDGKPVYNLFPNGLYKFNMSMFNEADSNVCELVYVFEVRFHFNLKDLK